MDIDAFFSIGYGMYIVTSESEGKINGQVVNAINQITVDPNVISVSICNDNYTHELISKSKKINVSVLDENTPMKLIELFGLNSGRNINKFLNTEHLLSENGAPFIKNNVVSQFVLEVIDSFIVGDHTIFIGNVISAEMLSKEKPLSYAEYRKNKKACLPKENCTEEGMEKYECSVCHYIYDPQKGDDTQGISPRTSFDSLPDNWICPICKKPKSVFAEI